MVVKRTTTITKGKSPKTKTTIVVRPPRRRRGRKNRGSAPRYGKMHNDGNRYLRCLLSEGGPVKIPDGDTHHSVAIEYRSTQTITPDAGGQIVVAAAPGLPGTLRIFHGGGAIQNMGGVTTPLTTVGEGGCTVPFRDFIPSGAAVTSNILQVNQGTRIVSARTVKYSLEMIQVGPVLNQQGSVATARVANLVGGGTAIQPTVYDYSAADALFPGHTYANMKGIIPTRPGFQQLTFDTVANYPTAKMCNATEACLLIGKGCGEWVPAHLEGRWWVDQAGAKQGDTVAFTSALPMSGNSTGAWGGSMTGPLAAPVVVPCVPFTTDGVLVGDFWTDPDCETLVWAGNNLGTGTTFEARVTACIELDIAFDNSIYRPLVSPPAENDPVALNRADDIMKIMPPSISKAEGSQSWWNALTTGVTGLADMVGDMGVPILSPAAKIGARMARMLGVV